MTNNKKAPRTVPAVGTQTKTLQAENNTIPEEMQGKNLWQIISDLDDCKIGLEQERDTFSLILEDLEDSVNGSYLERALMDVSALNLVYKSFCNSLGNYQKLISVACDRYRLEVPRED